MDVVEIGFCLLIGALLLAAIRPARQKLTIHVERDIAREFGPIIDVTPSRRRDMEKLP